MAFVVGTTLHLGSFSEAATVSRGPAPTRRLDKPEWILTGQEYHDYPLFPRTWDQKQAAHAFGMGVLSPTFRPRLNFPGTDQVVLGSAGGSGVGTAVSRSVAVRWLPKLEQPGSVGSRASVGSAAEARLDAAAADVPLVDELSHHEEVTLVATMVLARRR